MTEGDPTDVAKLAEPSEDIRASASIALVGRLLRESELKAHFLEDSDERRRMLASSGLSDGLGDDIREIFTRIPPKAMGRQAPSGHSAFSDGRRPDGWTDEMVKEWHSICMEPFKRIRYSFWLSIGMSAALFLIGSSLFAIATWRSAITGAADVGSLLIAGLGVVDFVALVYTRPLKDISRTLESTQRAGILSMSYLAGLPLIRQDSNSMRNLETLMKAVLMVEESRPSVSPESRNSRKAEA